jgi:DNA (cytosine-5)-methyltransferase 1
MSLSVYDEFCGFGGSSQGLEAIPGVETVLAANHAKIAVDVHALNFPKADHHIGDVTKADLSRFPRADIFWASPSCPAWTDARGKRRDFDTSTQESLFDLTETPSQQAERLELAKRRALMEEVPRYLRAVAGRGEPVLAGVVENVVQCRKWDQWHRWLHEIQALGYETRVIALNSMHAAGRHTSRAPQSRDRLYVAYWLKSLGRKPDWDKWLRPTAYCPTCDQTVSALQVFKKPGVDMGRYGRHGQYYYRCPNTTCRHQVIHPEVLPASAAIDFSLDPGQKIGERVIQSGKNQGQPDPLQQATIERITHGLARLAGRAMLAPAGGTWRDTATGLDEPMPTRTTRESDGLVLPPMLVPTTARTGETAYSTEEPFRTQTCRRETAIVLPPRGEFITVLRGGGSKQSGYRPVDEQPLATFSAQGGHQALIGPPGTFLMSYYRNGTLKPVDEPIGTLTTRDRYAVIGAADVPAVEECTFRMLDTREIAAGMAFRPDYLVKGNKRQQTMGYGNAVTPPAAEIIGSALVEAITGQDLSR